MLISNLIICIVFSRDGIVLFRPKILQNKFEENTVSFDGGDSVGDVTAFIQNN